MKILFSVVIFLVLTGCTSTGLYQWGAYEENLHNYYHKPQSREVIISRLEAHALKLESAGKLVPPGFYAELGTFYLELGDAQTAIEFYKKEAEVWPESRAFMNAIISNLAERVVEKETSDAS